MASKRRAAVTGKRRAGAQTAIFVDRDTDRRTAASLAAAVNGTVRHVGALPSELARGLERFGATMQRSLHG